MGSLWRRLLKVSVGFAITDEGKYYLSDKFFSASGERGEMGLSLKSAVFLLVNLTLRTRNTASSYPQIL